MLLGQFQQPISSRHNLKGEEGAKACFTEPVFHIGDRLGRVWAKGD
jgi:hypothetical protein